MADFPASTLWVSPDGATLPPSGYDAKFLWHKKWGRDDMFFSPSQCSQNGMRLKLKCPDSTCSGYITCNKRDVCPNGITPVKGICPGEDPAAKLPACLDKAYPVNLTTGMKVRAEIDYVGEGEFPLLFTRVYTNDRPVVKSARLGAGWRHNYDLEIYTAKKSQDYLVIYRSNGQRLTFTLDGKGTWADSGGSFSSLIELKDRTGLLIGWEYKDSKDIVETYDATGRLVVIRSLSGFKHTLKYNVPSSNGGDGDPETLDKVEHNSGKTLTFHYNGDGLLSRLIEPSGETYDYRYDKNSNLHFVGYSGEASGKNNNTWIRTYQYDDLNFSNLPDDRHKNERQFSLLKNALACRY